MTKIDELATKSGILGVRYIRNDWGIAINEGNNAYRILIADKNGNVMKASRVYDDVRVYVHFIIGRIRIKKGKTYDGYDNHIFVRYNAKPILGRNRFLDVSVAHDKGAAQPELNKTGKVLVASGLTRTYIINYLGKSIRVPDYVYSLQNSSVGNQEIVVLNTHLLGSQPIAWIDVDFDTPGSLADIMKDIKA